LQQKNNTSEKAKSVNLKLLEIDSDILKEKEPDEDKRLEVKNFWDISSLEIKSEIEKDAYKDYIIMCGVEGKIQKMAFSAAKDKIIKDYLMKNLSKYTAEEVKKVESIPFEKLYTENIEIIQSSSAEKSKNEKLEIVKEKAKEVTEINTAEEAKNIEITKIYKNMSMFQLDLLDLLEGENIKEVNKIIRLLGITKFFEGELGKLYLVLEYNEEEESIIKIKALI
ncbi:MAG: hypothetical protein ACRC4Y_00110, partial [Cetobacterium sp.]